VPNIVLILTDTTSRHYLGAYGSRGAITPHIDRLAQEGLLFENSYSSSPVCTPARGCIFTGVHAPVNGAWYNDATINRNVEIMGETFARAGSRVGYTGKWHLDGGLYFGYGKAQGGFPQRWWYDGKNYTDDLGPARTQQYRTWARAGWPDMRELAFEAEDCWGHRVTDRAIDFLRTAGDEPFLLCVAYDEPHGPFMAPREYLDAIDPDAFELRPNILTEVPGDKPEQQRILAEGHNNVEEDLRAYLRYYGACQAFQDAEMGRLLEVVDELHGDDTYVIFTSDHGEQMGSHGCWGKGPIMYEESVHTPLIVRGPGVPAGARTKALAGQVDLLPTFCDLAGVPVPAQVQGHSLAPVLRDPDASVNDVVFITYTLFGNDGEPSRDDEHDRSRLGQKAGRWFFPIRAVFDGRYKLAVNLLDTDELYDLQEDPYEMRNLIDEEETAAVRDRLHRRLLDELVATRDPMRCLEWARRPWAAADVV
jgi:uncharacterized sulfatase